MSIEKSTAIVLSVMPFRESSSIVTLFTKEHGRANGIAKGVRRSAKDALSLERGLLLELFLYVKPHRDLHTIGDRQVIEYFPTIRTDLGKLAVRDAGFEIVLKSVTSPGPHPELFAVLHNFLIDLEAVPSEPLPLALLAHFYAVWAHVCGFGLNFHECIRCGNVLGSEAGGLLSIDRGGFVCGACLGGKKDALGYMSGAAMRFIQSDLTVHEPEQFHFGSLREEFSIVRLLADHCRYHFDVRYELTSLGFIKSLIAGDEMRS